MTPEPCVGHPVTIPRAKKEGCAPGRQGPGSLRSALRAPKQPARLIAARLAGLHAATLFHKQQAGRQLRGSLREKVVPFPSSELTEISPP